MTEKSAFAALINTLYAQGAQHIVIRDPDHTTNVAIGLMADPATMDAVSAQGARVYVESPAEFNANLRDHARGQLDDAFIKESIDPFYGPNSDVPYEQLVIGSAERGTHLRFHDHGYGQMLKPAFPEHLQEQGQAYLNAVMAGDAEARYGIETGLATEQVKSLQSAIGDAFKERLQGKGDTVNAEFIDINAEGKPTLVLAGAMHEKLVDELGRNGKTADITVFSSDKPLPEYVARYARGEDVVSDILGDYAYDAATGRVFYLQDPSDKETFKQHLATLPSVEKEAIQPPEQPPLSLPTFAAELHEKPPLGLDPKALDAVKQCGTALCGAGTGMADGTTPPEPVAAPIYAAPPPELEAGRPR